MHIRLIALLALASFFVAPSAYAGCEAVATQYDKLAKELAAQTARGEQIPIEEKPLTANRTPQNAAKLKQLTKEGDDLYGSENALAVQMLGMMGDNPNCNLKQPV